MLDALLAAGHLEQLVIQRYIPVPVEAVLCKGLVERFAVTVLGVGKGAVHVENNSFNSHKIQISSQLLRCLEILVTANLKVTLH